MVAFIGVLSTFGFLICILLTVIKAIRKKTVKPYAIGTGVSFLLLIICLALTPDTESGKEMKEVAEVESNDEPTYKTEKNTTIEVVESEDAEPILDTPEEIAERIDLEEVSVTNEENIEVKAYATDTVRIRQQPNTECDVLGKVQLGNEVTVLGVEGDWSHITFNGIEGYIKSEYLTDGMQVPEMASGIEPTSAPVTTVAPTVEPSPTPAATVNPTVAAVAATTAIAASSAINSLAGGDSNFNTYDNVEQQQTTAQYVLNTSTMKVHYPKCKSVPKISPNNYDVSNEPFYVLEQRGYTSCGNCHAQ